MPEPSPSTSAPVVRSLAMGTDFLRRLESLSLSAGRLIATGNTATRAGAVRGGRVEFLEHRGYVEGDDLRDLDWNVYARTDEPFVKVFGAEREKRVTLLLDLSASMAAIPGKDLTACRLCAALAHVALSAGDTVSIRLTDRSTSTPTRKGLAASSGFIQWLERAPAKGTADWEDVIPRVVAERRAPGALVILSDFWHGGVVPLLLPLVKARQEVTLLHLLTPEELSPPLHGDVRLQDAESGEEVSLSLSESDLDAYRESVENHIEALADSARRHGMRHLLCRTDVPFEHMVLTYLRQGGLLR